MYLRPANPPGYRHERKARWEMPDNDEQNSPAYVTCRATLTAFKKDHPWFDDSDAGHDNGKAPLASFVLVEPAKYTERAVRILFKYAADSAGPSPLDQPDIGRQFTFQIQEDFLTAKSRSIDNATVRNFHNVQQ